MKRLVLAGLLGAFIAMPIAWAASSIFTLAGNGISVDGVGANDNDVLFTTGDLQGRIACTLQGTAGAVDVYASVDGTNFATAPLSLQDMGATSSDPVLVTAANRTYSVVAVAKRLRVLQNGATATGYTMNCIPWS